MEMSPWFVLLLGMGTVFVGLFAIILLTKLMSTFMGIKATASEPASKQQAAKAPAPAFLAGAGACMEAVKASYFIVTVPSAILYTPGQLTRLPQETVRRAVASTVTLLGA